MRNVRTGILFIIGLLATFLFVQADMAKAEIGVTDNEILIGSTMDLSGPLAFMGKSWKDGANLYFKYINDQGGIHGRKIKFQVEDDGFQAPRTVQGIKKLITKDKVFCMSMNMGAAGIMAAIPLLEVHKIPLLPAGTANAALTNPPRKYIFLVDTSYVTCAVIAAKYIHDTMKAKNPVPAVIYQEDITGQQWLQGVKEGFEKIYGIKNVLDLSYKRGAIDFSAQVARCKQAGATHIFIHGNIREPAAILKEAQRIQHKALFMCNTAAAANKVIELCGVDAISYSNGLYHVTYAVDNMEETTPGTTLYKNLIDKYKMCEVTNPMNGWGFNAAWVLCEVLKRAGKDLTREGFIKAAETINNFETTLMTPITWAADKRGGGDYGRIFKADPVKGRWTVLSEWIHLSKQ